MTNHMRVALSWISAACAGGLCLAPLQAHPVLTFSVASHVEPAPGQAQKPTDDNFPLTVVLGHQFLSTEAKGRRTIYDFERRRILRLDLQAKTFEDDSLFSDIGFRVLEFYNRIGLGSMLRSAKVTGPSSDTALVEHLFSLTDGKNNSVIDISKTHEGTTVYRWQQQTLLTVSDRTRKLPTDYQAEYWRFFRYYAGGHPKILDSMALIKGAPEKTTIVLYNFKTETRTMTLNGIASSPDAPYSLDGFVSKMPDREPYESLSMVGADAPQALQARVAAALKDRDTAFAQGRYLDAFLANDEASLSTGDANMDWLRSVKDKMNGDAQVLKLAGALAKHDSTQAPRIAEDLASLRALSPTYADVLDIFEGNTRLELRQAAQGEQLLLAAVKQDPYLTGAWHDLADMYYRSFRMPEAWSCMDVARRIAPNHPMLKPMNDLEETLRTKNPEFF